MSFGGRCFCSLRIQRHLAQYATLLLRKDPSKYEKQLLGAYQHAGRPGDGLDMEDIELIVGMVFRGQDCFALTEEDSKFFLNNGVDEKELPEGKSWSLQVDKVQQRCFLKDKSRKRLKSDVTWCDTLLAPVMKVERLNARRIRETEAFASFLPAGYGQQSHKQQDPEEPEVPTPTTTAPSSTAAAPSSSTSSAEVLMLQRQIQQLQNAISGTPMTGNLTSHAWHSFRN